MMKENEKHGSEWKTGSVCVRLYIGRVGVLKKNNNNKKKKHMAPSGAWIWVGLQKKRGRRRRKIQTVMLLMETSH